MVQYDHVYPHEVPPSQPLHRSLRPRDKIIRILHHSIVKMEPYRQLNDENEQETFVDGADRDLALVL